MRSTNDGGHAIELAVHSADEEMAALDALGPVTRQAIYDSPIRYSALPILKQVLDFEAEQRAEITGASARRLPHRSQGAAARCQHRARLA